jgi:hypothetical protein
MTEVQTVGYGDDLRPGALPPAEAIPHPAIAEAIAAYQDARAAAQAAN